MSMMVRSVLLSERDTELELARLHARLKELLREGEDPGLIAAQTRTTLAGQLSLAALLSDTKALKVGIAHAMVGDDPDVQFLADWAGFWAFGPEWRSPLPARPTRQAGWREDQQWMLNRRRRAHTEYRDKEGEIALIVGSGPLRAAVEVNGVSGIMILDTGAPSSVLTPEYASRAGLDVEGSTRVAYDGAGLRQTLCAARAAEMRVGNWTARNIPFDTSIIDAALATDGIMSPFDVFGRVGLTFDLSRARLIVGGPPDGAAASHPLFWSQGVASVRVQINGASALALLDTGAGATVLTHETAARARLARDAHEFRTATAFGAVSVTTLGTAEITIPGFPGLRQSLYAKQSTPIRLRPFPHLADAYLGQSWFAHYTVHFPVERGSLFLSHVETGSNPSENAEPLQAPSAGSS